MSNKLNMKGRLSADWSLPENVVLPQRQSPTPSRPPEPPSREIEVETPAQVSERRGLYPPALQLRLAQVLSFYGASPA